MRVPKLDPGTVPVAVAGTVALFLLGLGLSAGGRVLVGIACLLGLAAALTILRVDLAHAGLIATCGFAIVCSWNGWSLGGLRLRALLVIVAVVLLLAVQIGHRLPRLPWWNWVLAGSIVLASLLVEMLPISQDYLDHRFQETGVSAFEVGSNMGNVVRMLLTVLGATFAVVLCSVRFRRAPYWIAISYVAGNALSGAAAYFDFALGTTISEQFGGSAVSGGRASGFAEHPVVLTIGTVYSTAIAAWMLTRPRPRERVFGAVTLAALILGTYASGTRGGAICVVLAVAIALLLLPQYRRHIHLAALGTVVLYAAFFVVFPDVGKAILKKTRLFGAEDTGSSNTGRIDAMIQGLHDFAESPIYGIGLQVIYQAHNGYIQSLAAGGLILLVGMVCMQFSALVDALRLGRHVSLALPLAATMITRLVYDLIEGALVSLTAYVPVALIAGLLAQQHLREDGELPVDQPVVAHVRTRPVTSEARDLGTSR